MIHATAIHAQEHLWKLDGFNGSDVAELCDNFELREIAEAELGVYDASAGVGRMAHAGSVHAKIHAGPLHGLEGDRAVCEDVYVEVLRDAGRELTVDNTANRRIARDPGGIHAQIHVRKESGADIQADRGPHRTGHRSLLRLVRRILLDAKRCRNDKTGPATAATPACGRLTILSSVATTVTTSSPTASASIRDIV